MIRAGISKYLGGGGPAFTVIVMVFEVAGELVAQIASLVITQLTISPLARAVLAYVGLLAPTSLPLTFH